MPTTITTNDTTRFARYVYAYKYDDRGRVKEKHTPGAGWTYIVYNKIDNPILTQDADQRTRNEWIFSKYDEFGRIAVTGLYENSSTTTQAAMQTLADGTAYTLWETRAVAANSDWTATAFPTSSTGTITIHNVNYYDRYDFPGKESFTGMGADLTRVQGLLTGSKTTVLDASPYNLTNTVYYDTKGRVVQTIINQPKVGNDAVKDVVSNTYSFTGQLLTTTRKQTKGGTAMFTLATTNNYDHAGRLKTVQQKMDNDPNVTVASNIYNALGQLKQIKLHQTGGNLPAETIDYEYNIRGWLTSIASQNFSELLYYNTVISGFNTNSQWGGNISAVEWKAPAKDGEWHVYKYNYDNLNRLTEGVYTRRISTPGGIIYTGVPGMFNESFSYDNKNMGNIDKLNRYHGNPLDKSDALTYTYNGNQVTKIEDASTSTSTVGFPNGTANYTYNEAGRLKKDDQKGITAIAYNHLGLPTKIEKGSSSANHLVYTYDGTGRKLAKQLGSGTKRYYIDGVEYENANLQFISTPYGRIRKETSGWQYDYFLKDHLGNVRVVLEAGTAGGSRGGDNTAVYIATMEESRAAEESQYFENVDATRADRPFNYPDKNPTNAKVSKVPGKSEGLKLTLNVMAGDTIEISAKAFYNMDNTYPGASVNVAPIIGGILAGMTNPVSTVLGETSQLANDLGTIASNSTALSNLPDEKNENNLVKPQSGINFVLYNSGLDVVEENTGYLPVDDRINAIQNLVSDRMIMTEAGFFEIFVNNEAQTPVYYDNVTVTMRGGNVSEVNAYYPSGMMIPDLSTAIGNLADFNAYKYNNAEYETDLNLKWYNLGNRGLDPAVMRFWTPDKYAEKYYHLSPYSLCAGNPIRYIDVNGDSIHVSTQITDNEALNESFNQFATSKEGKKFLANYASKGQIIAGHKYTKDGKYHTKGINLNYTAEKMNDRGRTGKSEDGTITVRINSSSVVDSQDGNSYNSMNGKEVNPFYVMSKTITFFHESFIHVDLYTADFLHNEDKKFDYSNIPQEVKNHTNKYMPKYRAPSEYHHTYVGSYLNQSTLWPNAASRGIIEVNSKLGKLYTEYNLNTMMWNFNGGK